MPTNQEQLRTVRALIVLDPIAGIGRTQEDEIEQILQIYKEDHDLRLDANSEGCLRSHRRRARRDDHPSTGAR